PGQRYGSWVVLLLSGHVAGVEPVVGCPAVVELVEHLRFVQRQVALVAADEDVAFEPPALGLELLAGAEEAGIVGHVEHAEEPDPPRVLLGRAFFNKYRYPAVDRLGDVSVALGAEDWAGAGVGVE